jgi:hypothetical protein
MSRAVMVHAFNPSTREAEAGGSLSSKPAWSTKWVPGQPGLYRETLSQKTKKKKKKVEHGGKPDRSRVGCVIKVTQEVSCWHKWVSIAPRVEKKQKKALEGSDPGLSQGKCLPPHRPDPVLPFSWISSVNILSVLQGSQWKCLVFPWFL